MDLKEENKLRELWLKNRENDEDKTEEKDKKKVIVDQSE